MPSRAGVERADRTRNRTPLWRCPRCGHRFTSRNMSHSCGRYRIADHFKDRIPGVRRIFDEWRRAIRACGPVSIYAEKTRIVFQARVRFAAALVRENGLEVTLWLPQPVDHPRVRRIDALGRLGFIVHFLLTSSAEIDPELAQLVRQSYAEHVDAPHRDRPTRNKAPRTGPGAQR